MINGGLKLLSKKRKSIVILILITLIVLLMLEAGCFGIKGKHFRPSDELSRAMVETLDSKVIVYDGKHIKDRTTIYTLTIQSDNTEGAGDEIKKLYAAVNDVLQHSECVNRIEIDICHYHFDMGAMNYTAQLLNFKPNSNRDFDNRISYIYVIGIDDMYKYYDKEYVYELNCYDYWNSYTDTTEIEYSEYVKCLNSAYTCYPDIEKILNDEYSTDIRLAVPYVYGNTYREMISFDIFVDNESLYEGDEDLIKLFETIRDIFNNYLLENSDCELTGKAIHVDFYLDNDVSCGWFSNCLYGELYDDFACIGYNMATVEELIACDGIVVISLKGRSLEEINFVLSNMDGIESVIIYDSELVEELRRTYSDIEFY